MRFARPAALSICLLSALAGAAEPATPPKSSKPKAGSTQAKPAFAPRAFTPACENPSYPTPVPQTALGIDAQCGVEGIGSGPEGVQDSVKNNFCATGEPQPITLDDLKNLQAKVEQNPAINFGDEPSAGRKKGPTTDRSLLQALGEGKLVSLKAYVLLARQEGGESVNCGKDVTNAALFHDIHISLLPNKDATKDDECASVVAEMSPHRRPSTWTHERVLKVSEAKALVRVTGQLYFDSSHVPCANGQHVRSNPKRVSLWEIHPIYKFEVCTADCDGAGQWVTLDQWTPPKGLKPAR